MSKIKPIAFYLPQFHPIPENDEWWGKGFTEWTNVTKARPLFPGHYQPHLPADLGFYDLRLPEARQAQADLAREYGIHGFCYYHYWFNGKRLLERPFNEVLSSGEPDFPFCLCWANENWTRTWDGQDRHILAQQVYDAEDDRRHIRWLAKAFLDQRYIRYEGKPVFLVYLASRLPRPLETTSIWREEARKLGVGEIFLCRVESDNPEKNDPASLGFDCSIEFQPDWSNLGTPFRRTRPWSYLRRLGISNHAFSHANVYEYAEIVERMLAKETPRYCHMRCVTPAWDNSARRKHNPYIIRNSTPQLYAGWLKKIIETATPNSEGEKFIFINAWNEWAEGNHLEPCQKWGRAYLEATLDALKS
jgi:lipopolysaccharide biosynthesis protein